MTTGNAYTGAYQFNENGTLTAVNRGAALANHNVVYVLPTENEWYKAAYFKAGGGGYSQYASGLNAIPTHGTGDGWNYYSSVNGFVNSSPNNTWDVGFGGQEQNGTYDMMGNVWEWNESAWDGTLDNMTEARVRRGGSYFTHYDRLKSDHRDITFPDYNDKYTGFRIVSYYGIPEPSSILLMAMVGGGGLFMRRMSGR